ncbi:MAG: TetR/AcrR family transcriptional regulator [Deltaproteobacteria bacterium]|jgi:AcrR family transcriptional regulator|nr:TetR/AcrR family transcriptional regulator [Deltaproteobacteria bacterium]
MARSRTDDDDALLPPTAAVEVESHDGEPADGRALRAERRRNERREAILQAAQRVFRDKGYHQASVHDIIDEARIARGTFYLYFTSKQEIFAVLVDEFLRLIRTQVRRISLEPGADAPLEQLRANFRRIVLTVVGHDDLASIILRDPTSFDEESRARVNLFFDQALQLIEDALRVGQGLRLVRECDVHLVAVTALGGLRLALVHMLEAHGEDPGVRARERSFEHPERVADELMAFFLRGMTPPVSPLPNP